MTAHTQRIIGGSIIAFMLCLGAFAVFSLYWHVTYPYDGRQLRTGSENIMHTRLGEPVKWTTYVQVTEVELAKLGDVRGGEFDKDDHRILREGEGKLYIRTDLYTFYRGHLQ